MNVVKSGTFKLPFRDKILASSPSMYQIQLIHFSMSLAHMAINLHLAAHVRRRRKGSGCPAGKDRRSRRVASSVRRLTAEAAHYYSNPEKFSRLAEITFWSAAAKPA
jgi:hypothetical protein